MKRGRTPPSSLDELEDRLGRDWIRDSTQRQFDRHDGNAQRQNCLRFRERFGVVDGGPAYIIAQSGKTVWKSPTMRQLIDDVRAEKFDLLICGYFDRWQRNLRRTLEIVEDELHPHGVSWVMADRRLISGNRHDWQLMVDEAHQAEVFSDNLAEKVRDGYEAKRDIRHDQGGGLVPIGFMRDPATKLVVPDPEIMPIAVRAWDLSAEGWTDAAIAAELDLTLWQVRKILRSDLFKGLVRPGNATNFPAPIDLEVRLRAGDHRLARTRVGNRARTYRIYPLSGGGPAVCQVCDRPLKGNAKVRRNGERVRVYRHPDGPPCSGWPFKEVPAAILEEQVAAKLEGASPSPEVVKRIHEAFARPAASVDRLGVARVDAHLKRLGQEITSPLKSRTRAEILDEIDAQEAERSRLLATPVTQEMVSPDDALRYLRSLGKLWRDTDDEGRRMLAVGTFTRLGVLAVGGRGSHEIVSFDVIPDAERKGLAISIGTGARSAPEELLRIAGGDG